MSCQVVALTRYQLRLTTEVLLVGHLLSAKARMLPCSGVTSVWIAHRRFGKITPVNCRRKRYWRFAASAYSQRGFQDVSEHTRFATRLHDTSTMSHRTSSCIAPSNRCLHECRTKMGRRNMTRNLLLTAWSVNTSTIRPSKVYCGRPTIKSSIRGRSGDDAAYL